MYGDRHFIFINIHCHFCELEFRLRHLILLPLHCPVILCRNLDQGGSLKFDLVSTCVIVETKFVCKHSTVNMHVYNVSAHESLLFHTCFYHRYKIVTS